MGFLYRQSELTPWVDIEQDGYIMIGLAGAGVSASASASANSLSITGSRAKDQTKQRSTFLHMQVLDAVQHEGSKMGSATTGEKIYGFNGRGSLLACPGGMPAPEGFDEVAPSLAATDRLAADEGCTQKRRCVRKEPSEHRAHVQSSRCSRPSWQLEQ